MSEYTPIIYWKRCNPPIRGIIGSAGLYMDGPPRGLDWVYSNSQMQPLTEERLRVERKRRAGDPLTEREAERYR